MSAVDDAIKAAPPTGIKRLLKRKAPEAIHYLRAVEPEVERVARKAAEDARERLDTATMRIDDKADAAIRKAQRDLDQANAALAACYEPIVVRALPPSEFEALVAEYPAREGKEEPYNGETFGPELFLRCVQGDLTREQWAEEVIPSLSNGEIVSMQVKALDVNARFSDGLIPKG